MLCGSSTFDSRLLLPGGDSEASTAWGKGAKSSVQPEPKARPEYNPGTDNLSKLHILYNKGVQASVHHSK